MASSNDDMKKTIAIIGSTGSIGTQSIDVVRTLKNSGLDFEIVGISARSSESFKTQLYDIKPRAYAFSKRLSASDSKYFSDSSDMIEYLKPDITVIASSGGDSLTYTVSAIKNSKRVCLANKESMVLAGDIVNSLAKKYDCELIPVDSEHSGVFQLLENERVEDIDKAIITASGGALRNWNPEDLNKATVEDVLNHPTWHMGSKITVDSATLFNKGLEVIEAKRLFSLKKEQIDTVFCYSSYIHAMIVFKDGVIKVHSGKPDMRIPIGYAMTYPERLYEYQDKALRPEDLTIKTLEIESYPALKMAFDILDMPNSYSIIYNAANEIAVDWFLKERIGFTTIFEIVDFALNRYATGEIDTIEEIITFHDEIKKKTEKDWRRLL